MACLYMYAAAAAAVCTDALCQQFVQMHCVWHHPPPGLCADAEQLHCPCVQVVS